MRFGSIFQSERLLGFTDDLAGPHKIEVEWQLNVPFWGRGYATEGGRAGVRYGFEALSLDRIISITVPQHVVSRRIMQKCGLTYQGILQLEGPQTRTKRDIVWYAIDRSAWELQTGSRERGAQREPTG